MSEQAERAGLIEALAIEFHQQIEGEYGCPGATCPGVRRLVAAFTELEGVGRAARLTSREMHKGTGDVLRDLQHAQRFTDGLSDGLPGVLGKEAAFIDRALRVAIGEIKQLRQRLAQRAEETR